MSGNRKTVTVDPKLQAYFELRAQLPFLSSTSSWALPPKGHYVGGYRSGKAAAKMYLKFLRECQRTGHDDGRMLVFIALSMLSGGGRKQARKGQISGFFAELDNVLASAVSQMPGLDGLTFGSLADDVHAGVNWSEAAFNRRCNSEAARRGWATHKARQGSAPSTPDVPTADSSEEPRWGCATRTVGLRLVVDNTRRAP